MPENYRDIHEFHDKCYYCLCAKCINASCRNCQCDCCEGGVTGSVETCKDFIEIKEEL